MELIAEKGFNDLIYDDKITDKIPSFKKLSLEESEEKEVLIFSWFYILESGDSAKLFVEVDKKGKFWENDPSRISTNSKWSYMFSPTSQFMSLIPQMMDISYLDKVNSVKVLGESFQDMDSSKLFLSEEKLFFILKEGYFNILMKYDDHTVVAFYETIASIDIEGKAVPTLTAKIIFKDNRELVIVPYNAPMELWQNYNKY